MTRRQIKEQAARRRGKTAGTHAMKKHVPPHDRPSLPGEMDIYRTIQALSSAFQNRGEDQELRAIGFYARHALKELLRLSERAHKKAEQLLFETLTTSVTEFDEYCRQQLSHLPKDYTTERHPSAMDVRDFARRSWVWPGLLSRDADLVKANAELIESLGLANEVGISFSEKSKRMWTRNTPEIAVALKLRNIVNGYRTKFKFTNLQSVLPGYEDYEETANLAKSLAPLSRDNYAAWFKAAEPAFIKLYGTDFESHTTFKGYWQRDAYKERKPNKPSEKQLKANARVLIRRDIKKQIKQAFRSLAPRSSSA